MNQTNNNQASIKVYNQESLDINIYSAFEIEKDEINEIANAVSKKYNFIVNKITFKLDPELIAGVKVVFDSNVIDNTLKAKLSALENNTKNRI